MNIRIRLAALAVTILTVTPIAWADSADAARRPVRSPSLQVMARAWHCNILATPGPDFYRGSRIPRSWLIGVDGKAIFVVDPADFGWEPPPGPRGRDWVKAICQLPPPR